MAMGRNVSRETNYRRRRRIALPARLPASLSPRGIAARQVRDVPPEPLTAT